MLFSKKRGVLCVFLMGETDARSEVLKSQGLDAAPFCLATALIILSLTLELIDYGTQVQYPAHANRQKSLVIPPRAQFL